MQEPFISYLALFEKLHQEAAAAIDGLPVEALDWTPGPEMNSITVLMVHTAASQRYWVGDVAMGEPSNRVRSTEFVSEGLTSHELKQRLADALEYTRQAIGRLTVEELDAPRSSPRQDSEYSVAYALLHALEHTALHVGHVQLTRQLWEQQAVNSK
jgi:hypothetical protein